MAVLAITASIDGTLLENAPDLPSNSGATLTSKNWTGTAKNRAVMAFNVTSLPDDAVISAATLSYNMITNLATASEQKLDTLYIRPELEGATDEVDAGLCWNVRNAALTAWIVAGGDMDNLFKVTFTPPTLSPNTIQSHNVKELLEWAIANHQHKAQIAFIIYGSAAPNTTWTISSLENVSGKQVPTLTITYSVPGLFGSRPGGRFRNGRPLPTSRPIRGNEE